MLDPLIPAKLLASVSEELDEADEEEPAEAEESAGAEELAEADAEEVAEAEASGLAEAEEVAEAEASAPVEAEAEELSASAEAEELLDGLGAAEAEALGLAVAEAPELTGSGSTLLTSESVQPEPKRRSATSINAATEHATQVGPLRAVRSRPSRCLVRASLSLSSRYWVLQEWTS